MRRLRVEHYCIRHGNRDGRYRLQNWRLEGSKDGGFWEVIDEREEDQSLPECGYGVADFEVDHSEKTPDENGQIEGSDVYRFFRILLTGPNSNGGLDVHCAGIELYGELQALRELTEHEVIGARVAEKKEAAKAKAGKAQTARPESGQLMRPESAGAGTHW